jgi:hypothetical protein
MKRILYTVFALALLVDFCIAQEPTQGFGVGKVMQLVDRKGTQLKGLARVEIRDIDSLVVLHPTVMDLNRQVEVWFPPFASDFDTSGRVSLFNDFFLFSKYFGSYVSFNSSLIQFDLDGDGFVGFPDFFTYAGQFGRTASGLKSAKMPAIESREQVISLLEDIPSYQAIRQKNPDVFHQMMDEMFDKEFGPQWTNSFSIPSPNNVMIQIFNMLGQAQSGKILSSDWDAVHYALTHDINGRAYGTGMLFIQYYTPNGSLTRKFTPGVNGIGQYLLEPPNFRANALKSGVRLPGRSGKIVAEVDSFYFSIVSMDSSFVPVRKWITGTYGELTDCLVATTSTVYSPVVTYGYEVILPSQINPSDTVSVFITAHEQFDGELTGEIEIQEVVSVLFTGVDGTEYVYSVADGEFEATHIPVGEYTVSFILVDGTVVDASTSSPLGILVNFVDTEAPTVDIRNFSLPRYHVGSLKFIGGRVSSQTVLDDNVPIPNSNLFVLAWATRDSVTRDSVFVISTDTINTKLVRLNPYAATFSIYADIPENVTMDSLLWSFHAKSLPDPSGNTGMAMQVFLQDPRDKPLPVKIVVVNDPPPQPPPTPPLPDIPPSYDSAAVNGNSPGSAIRLYNGTLVCKINGLNGRPTPVVTWTLAGKTWTGTNVTRNSTSSGILSWSATNRAGTVVGNGTWRMVFSGAPGP